jgi:glutamate synthase (ferredoxin)
MMFLPLDEDHAVDARSAFEDAVRHRGLEPLTWRTVPIDPSALGEQAIARCPASNSF